MLSRYELSAPLSWNYLSEDWWVWWKKLLMLWTRYLTFGFNETIAGTLTISSKSIRFTLIYVYLTGESTILSMIESELEYICKAATCLLLSNYLLMKWWSIFVGVFIDSKWDRYLFLDDDALILLWSWE
jgi:hypothetical protein